jgi:hypothetical protein
MYTVEIYKADKRTKAGERLVHKQDCNVRSFNDAEDFANNIIGKILRRSNGRYEIRETYVVRENMMTGEKFEERYDRSRYCSPASESYWSM